MLEKIESPQQKYIDLETKNIDPLDFKYFENEELLKKEPKDQDVSLFLEKDAEKIDYYSTKKGKLATIYEKKNLRKKDFNKDSKNPDNYAGNSKDKKKIQASESLLKKSLKISKEIELSGNEKKKSERDRLRSKYFSVLSSIESKNIKSLKTLVRELENSYKKLQETFNKKPEVIETERLSMEIKIDEILLGYDLLERDKKGNEKIRSKIRESIKDIGKQINHLIELDYSFSDQEKEEIISKLEKNPKRFLEYLQENIISLAEVAKNKKTIMKDRRKEILFELINSSNFLESALKEISDIDCRNKEELEQRKERDSYFTNPIESWSLKENIAEILQIIDIINKNKKLLLIEFVGNDPNNDSKIEKGPLPNLKQKSRQIPENPQNSLRVDAESQDPHHVARSKRMASDLEIIKNNMRDFGNSLPQNTHSRVFPSVRK